MDRPEWFAEQVRVAREFRSAVEAGEVALPTAQEMAPRLLPTGCPGGMPDHMLSSIIGGYYAVPGDRPITNDWCAVVADARDILARERGHHSAIYWDIAAHEEEQCALCAQCAIYPPHEWSDRIDRI